MIPQGFTPHWTPDGGFADKLGTLYSRVEGDQLHFGFLSSDGDTNAMGGVHGGRLMTFADQVLGLTVQHVLQTNRVATVSLNCDFVSGARPGQWIEGDAKIIRMTKAIVFVEGAIYHEGHVIMKATGLWYRRPNSPERDTKGAAL